ncbi:hypothetical protein [Agromyces sp. NPDC058104]|uniref:hypothetical protein n=1 Tax=Agromyces sp. NPDC058104 TaxID=3346342 RepID=UPI0036D8F6D9
MGSEDELTLEGPIGVIGDPGGSADGLDAAAGLLGNHGVRVIVVLGDPGVRPDSMASDPAARDFVDHLREREQYVLLAGPRSWGQAEAGLDREDPATVHSLVDETVGIMPNGLRGRLEHGREFGVLGDLASAAPPGQARIRGTEHPAEADLDRLGTDVVDVLFGYDAPLDLLTLPHPAEAEQPALPRSTLTAREQFQRGFELVEPRLCFSTSRGGFTHEAVGYPGFWTEAVVLDKVGGGGPSLAILEPRSLRVHVVEHSGRARTLHRPVVDITNRTSGKWEVTTAGSRHILDLDHRFWERIPGPEAPAFELSAGSIRSLARFKLGECGFLTCPGDDFFEYYWAQTSYIRHIRRFQDKGDVPQ